MRRTVAIVCLVLLIALRDSSAVTVAPFLTRWFGVPVSPAHQESTSSEFFFTAPGWSNYGCSSSPAKDVVAPFVNQIQDLLYVNAGDPAKTPTLWSMQVNTGWPPDADWYRWRDGYNDIMRLLVKMHRSDPSRPRVLFTTRGDERARNGAPDIGGNVRRENGKQGCDSDSSSFLSGSTRSCDLGSVPMCSGGTRDGMWCPIDKGNTWCPGGTCAQVAASLGWVLTTPAAEHATALGSFYSVSASTDDSRNTGWSEDFLCDGTQLVWGTGSCGAGYPSAPATLPAKSIGKYLYDHNGNVWPLPYKPHYYGNPPVTACVGGTNDKKTCPYYTCTGGTCSGTVNRFNVISVGFDLRIAAYQKWIVAEALDKVYQSFRWAGATDSETQSWPVVIEGFNPKPGWWAHYDHTQFPADNPACDQSATTHMWNGPANLNYPASCYQNGGPMNISPYGPGEFEAATNATQLEALRQTTVGKFCSSSSVAPYTPCTTSADCQFGTCETAIDNYFDDMQFSAQDAPSYRGIANSTVSEPVTRNPRWLGSRRTILNYQAAPFYSGNGQKLCETTPYSDAGTAYTTTASPGKVRLIGRCLGPPTVVATWSIVSGCSGCSFVDPYNETTAATHDLQAMVKGATTSGVVKLACDAAESTATVTVP